jgi:hypothetical protein
MNNEQLAVHFPGAFRCSLFIAFLPPPTSSETGDAAEEGSAAS